MKRRPRRWLLGLFLVLAAGAAGHSWWLRWLGELLVSSEPPVKAELILVLAGDWSGSRILKAAELVEAGYAAKALVSSPMHHYGIGEGDLAIEFAERHGHKREIFEAVPIKGNSTREEAVELLRNVRRRGVRRILVVTSNYHTYRSRRIYEGMRDGIEIHVTAAPFVHYEPDSWWRERESRKVWLLEFTKLVTGIFGI